MSDSQAIEYIHWPCGRRQHIVVTASHGVTKKYLNLPRGPRNVALTIPRLQFLGTEIDRGTVHYVFARDGGSSASAGIRVTLFKVVWDPREFRARIEPTAEFKELVTDCALPDA